MTRKAEKRDMTRAEWLELERIAKNGNLEPPRGRGAVLLNMTRWQDEHPEWYEYACECRLCASYSDL